MNCKAQNANKTAGRRFVARFASVLTGTALTIATLAGAANAQSYIGANNGNWFVAANWSGGVVPGAGASVTNASANTVVYNGGATTLASYNSTGTAGLTIGSGTLTATTTGVSAITMGGTLLMSGATLSGFVVNSGASNPVRFTNTAANVWNAITANADLDLATTTGILRTTNGFILGGTATINSNSILTVENSSTLGGTGSIVFGNTGSSNRLNIEGTTTLTLGSGMTVRGQNGTIGGQAIVGGVNTLVNNGLVSADVSGGTIGVSADAVTNNSVLEARNGGTLALNAAVTQGVGATIRSVGAGSVVRFSGVQITGQTLSTSGGGAFVISNSGGNVWDATTMNGALDLASATSILRTVNGFTLNGTTTINASSVLTTENTAAFGGTGSIVFGDTGANNRLNIEGASTLTIGSGITVRGQNGTIGGQVFVGGANALVNNGLISADVSGGTISITAPTTNNNALEARSGGTLSLNAAVTQSAGGKILSTDATSVVRQNGVRITGGTVQTISGGAFSPTNNSANFLDAVTLDGTLDMASSLGIERVVNGLTFVNATVSVAAGSLLTSESSQTWSGTGAVVFGSAVNRLNIEGATTLTLGSGITVRGQNGTIGQQVFVGGANALVNNGLVSADVSGGTFSVVAPTTNNTVIEARNGATLIVNAPMTQSTTANLQAVGTGSQVVQNGHRITGGTLTTTGTGTLVASNSNANFLDAVTLAGRLDMATAVGVERVVNGLTLSGGTVSVNSGSLLTSESNQTWIGAGAVVFGNTGANNRVNIEGATTLTIGAGVAIRGQNGTIGGQVFVGGTNALANNGTIAADVSGGTISVTTGSLTNAGTLQAITGATLVLPASVPQSAGQTVANGTVRIGAGTGTLTMTGGSLTGNGTLAGSVVNTSGTISAGMSPGTLLITGSLAQGTGATLLVELGGTTAGTFDLLQVSGTASLAGNLQVNLVNGFAPTFVGQTFRFTTASAVSGTFGNISASSPGFSPGFTYAVDYGTNFTDLRVTGLGTPTVVPEAGTLLLMVLGTGSVALVLRRRK